VPLAALAVRPAAAWSAAAGRGQRGVCRWGSARGRRWTL